MDQVDSDRQTSLRQAAQMRHWITVKLLLEKSADFRDTKQNERDISGSSC